MNEGSEKSELKPKSKMSDNCINKFFSSNNKYSEHSPSNNELKYNKQLSQIRPLDEEE